MSAGWVAGSVRARALARWRVGELPRFIPGRPAGAEFRLGVLCHGVATAAPDGRQGELRAMLAAVSSPSKNRNSRTRPGCAWRPARGRRNANPPLPRTRRFLPGMLPWVCHRAPAGQPPPAGSLLRARRPASGGLARFARFLARGLVLPGGPLLVGGDRDRDRDEHPVQDARGEHPGQRRAGDDQLAAPEREGRRPPSPRPADRRAARIAGGGARSLAATPAVRHRGAASPDAPVSRPSRGPDDAPRYCPRRA